MWAPDQPSPQRTCTGGTEVLSPEVPPARGPVTPDLVSPPCSAEADLGASSAVGGCSAPTSKDAARWSCCLVRPAGGQSPSPFWLVTGHRAHVLRCGPLLASVRLSPSSMPSSALLHCIFTSALHIPIRISMTSHKKELCAGFCPRPKALSFPTFHWAPQALGQWGE